MSADNIIARLESIEGELKQLNAKLTELSNGTGIHYIEQLLLDIHEEIKKSK